MKIESMYEMEWDEINNALRATWQHIEALYMHPHMKPKKTQGIIERQIDFNLKSLADSIKQGLIYLYPEKKKDIQEATDANEAWWFRQTLEETRIIPTPLYEGIEALLKIFLLLEGYKIDYQPGDLENIRSEFDGMEKALKEYAPIAREQRLVKRERDRRSKGGKHQKRLKGILAAVEGMIQNKSTKSYSAEHLWNIFKIRHNGEANAMTANEYKVFFNNDDPDMERLFQRGPDRELRYIGRSAFNGYVSKAKNLK